MIIPMSPSEDHNSVPDHDILSVDERCAVPAV